MGAWAGGGPQGDPRGILRGSRLKTRDPGLGRPIKIGGSGETTLPLYNIKKVHELFFGDGVIDFRVVVDARHSF